MLDVWTSLTTKLLILGHCRLCFRYILYTVWAYYLFKEVRVITKKLEKRNRFHPRMQVPRFFTAKGELISDKWFSVRTFGFSHPRWILLSWFVCYHKLNHQGHHCSRPENTRTIYTKQEYSCEAGWEKGYRVVLREVRRVDTSWSRILSNLLQYGHFILFYFILLAFPLWIQKSWRYGNTSNKNATIH